jgi:hypothetical protein
MIQTLNTAGVIRQVVATHKSGLFRSTAILLCFLACSFCCQSTLADDFKMNCDVQGTIPAMPDKVIAPARVALVIQTLGNNIFIQIVGPSPYEMKVSTLATKVMSGSNLTNPKHLGVRAKNKETGQESELVIDQKTVTLSGYNDIDYQKQIVRLAITGQCILPK